MVVIKCWESKSSPNLLKQSVQDPVLICLITHRDTSSVLQHQRLKYRTGLVFSVYFVFLLDNVPRSKDCK